MYALCANQAAINSCMHTCRDNSGANKIIFIREENNAGDNTAS